MVLSFNPVLRREGGGRAADPGGTLQGRHLRGENLGFSRLHCKFLQCVSVSLYLFLIYLVH